MFQLIVLATLCTAGILLMIKRNEKTMRFFTFLFILCGLQLMQAVVLPEENNSFITSVLTAFVSLNFIGASFIRHKIGKWATPILSILLLFLLGKNDLFVNDYSLNLADTKVISIVLFGFLVGVISKLITRFLESFFKEKEASTVNITAQIALVSLFIIPATFFVSWYGLVLLAVGYYAFNLVCPAKTSNLVFSLLSIALIAVFAQKYNLESVDITVGKVVAGFFVGVASYLLVLLSTKSTAIWLRYLLMIKSIILIILITLLNNIHPAYGGIESFVAALIAISLLIASSNNQWVAPMLIPTMLLIGYLVPSNPFEEQTTTEETASTNTVTSTKPTGIVKVIPDGIAADVLKGNYEINAETSIIDFQLGPKGGVTKGAIKNFEGKIFFANNIEQSTFEVSLATKNLTTFSKLRDKSIQSDEYLNEEKFPIMSYKSTKMTPKEDGYLLEGKFTLLGKTNTEEVFIKYAGTKDGKEQFWGKAAIDRRKYGMGSSPQEGDIVDFTFDIELIKK